MTGAAENTVHVRRRWIIGIIAAVLAVVVIVAVWWFVKPSGSTSGPVVTATSTPLPSPTSSPTDGGAAAVLPELPPVGLQQPIVAPDGVSAKLTKLESVDGEAVGAGDIAGPAIRVTVELSNGTSADFDTALTVVNAYYGADRTPANALVKPGGRSLSGTIASGASQDAVYIFSIPEDERGDVTITVDYAPGQPAIVFQGDASAPF